MGDAWLLGAVVMGEGLCRETQEEAVLNHLRLREEVKDGNRRMARLVCRSLFPQVRSRIFSLNKLFGSIAFHVLAFTSP
jgi:hypothetical protein